MNTSTIGARLGALGALSLASVAGLAWAAAPASAHVSATASDTTAGANTVVTLSVPHGCDGSPTTKVAISIPEGINAVTPTRNPFYRVQVRSEQLSPPVADAHGNEITERAASVVYTAITPLPEGQRDTFDLSLQLPEEAAGSTLYFPTIQTCRQGETAWTEVPADGQAEDDLESPAPAIAVSAATTDQAADQAAEESTGEPTAEPAADAASGAAEASDGGNGLALAGLGVGALGVLVGGAALARTRTSGNS